MTTSSPVRRAAALVAAALLPALAGCTDLTGVGDGLRLTSISVSSTVVEVGDTARVGARGRLGTSSDLILHDPLADARWSIQESATASLEPAPIAPVDTLIPKAQILVRGVRIGAATITASARGIAGSAEVRVIPRVTRVALLAQHDTVAVGEVAYVALGGGTADGQLLTDLPYAITSSDSTVAHVGGGGPDLAFVAGQAPGTVTLTVGFRHAAPATHVFVVVAKR